MPWWSKKTAPQGPSRVPARVVTASGARINLKSRKDVALASLAAKDWQTAAWVFVKSVPEASYATSFLGMAFQRIRIVAGFMRDPDEDPIPVTDAVKPTDPQALNDDLRALPESAWLDPDLARDAEIVCAELASIRGGQGALMRRLGENLFVPGEAWLVGRFVPERVADEGEDPAAVPKVFDWEIRSRQEVVKAKSGDGIMLLGRPGQQDGEPLDLTNEETFLGRLWLQDSEWSDEAWSAFRAEVGVLMELDLLGRQSRAAIRRRIFAGILKVPDELDFGNDDDTAEEGAGEGGPIPESFDSELAKAVAAAADDEDAIEALIPTIVRGAKAFLDGLDYLEIGKPPSKDDIERAEYLVKRFARGVNLPVEVILGMSDLNHWTAWQVDDATYEAHLEPFAMAACDALTVVYFRSRLLAMGHDPATVARLVTMPDASMLVRRPDKGKVASEGYGLDLINGAAWRQSNGFGDDDAPSDEELLRKFSTTKAILDGPTSLALLVAAGLIGPEVAAAANAALQAKQQAAIPAASTDTTDDQGPPADGAPDDGGGSGDAVQASAGRSAEWTAEHLAGIDRTLRERVLADTDAAMERALERAGNRLRTKAKDRPSRGGNAEAAALLAHAADPRQFARTLGPALTAAVATDDELLAGAFDSLEERFDALVANAQVASVAALTALLGRDLTDRERADIEAKQEEDRSTAWAWLSSALLALAAHRLYEDGGDARDTDGEVDPTLSVPAGMIREALGMAGGEQVVGAPGGGILTAAGDPVGGVATGSTVRDLFARQGFPWSGYRWVYTYSGAHPFEPHRALSGTEFGTWNDNVLANASGVWPGVAHFYPGDHRACRCDFAPTITAVAAEQAA